jgi:purine-binding chemotaxis protein CheW
MVNKGGSMSETVENDVAEAHEKTEKYLVFSIFDRRYTIPSRLIGEIALFDTVYPLPLMPDYILGVINRYSAPYALFDIGLMLFKTPGSRNKVLVLKDSIDRIAILIDDVIGIVDIPQDKLLDVERDADSDDLTEAVSASFNWDGCDVFVLEIQRIMARVSGGAA